MNTEIVTVSIVIVATIAAAATWVIYDNRQIASVMPAIDAPSSSVHIAAAPAIDPATQPVPPPRVAESAPAPAAAPLRIQSQAPVVQATPPRRVNPPADAPITEPMARQALAGVGTDPQAEAVWIRAINDDLLSPNDRRNLIEDLNETGFANPRDIGAADLPVIEYRLALIEDIAPNAMDDVNFAAFQEAYKDLTNMRVRLLGP